jgi:hypothetical protein
MRILSILFIFLLLISKSSIGQEESLHVFYLGVFNTPPQEIPLKKWNDSTYSIPKEENKVIGTPNYIIETTRICVDPFSGVGCFLHYLDTIDSVEVSFPLGTATVNSIYPELYFSNDSICFTELQMILINKNQTRNFETSNIYTDDPLIKNYFPCPNLLFLIDVFPEDIVIIKEAIAIDKRTGQKLYISMNAYFEITNVTY